MRPTRLIMNAFGPYRGRVDLDFTAFGSSSIYLVSGPTGSGKTTIFDAISYALYNKASGNERGVEMFKSQFATDEDLCFVDFTFEMGVETYRIKRNPTQKAPGARGTPINYAADVELFKNDEPIAQGASKVDTMVNDLLGLTHNQFRQIVLLPQGEFRQLLLSTSLEKEEIFRNLFGTTEIRDFQETLRENAKKYRDAYKEYGTRLNQTLTNIEVTGDEKLAAIVQAENYPAIIEYLSGNIQTETKKIDAIRKEQEKLNQEEKRYETWLQLLGEKNVLEEKERELEKEKSTIKRKEEALKLNQQAVKIKEEALKLEQLEKEKQTLAQSLKETKEALSENEKSLAELEKQLETSNKAITTLDTIREEIKQLEVEANQFIELDKIEKEQADKQNELKETKKVQVDLDKTAKQLEKEITARQDDLAQLSSWRKALDETREQLEQAQNKFNETTKEKEHLTKVIDLQKQLNSTISKEKEITEKAKKSAEQYEEARKHYFGNLAGILVDELVEDEPCPVCGSTHHPNPTVMDTHAVTKEALAELETAKSADQSTLVKIQSEMDQVGHLISEQVGLLMTDHSDYLTVLSQITEMEQALDTEIKDYKEQIQMFTESIQQEETWQKALENAQAEKNKNQLHQQEVSMQQSQAENRVKELEATHTELLKTLQFESTKAVEEEIANKKIAIQIIEKEANRIQSEMKEREIEASKLNTTMEHLTTQIDTHNKQLTEQQAVFDKLLEEVDFEGDYKKYVLADHTVRDYQKQIDTYKEEQMYTIRELKKNEDALKDYDATQSKEVIQEAFEMIKVHKREMEETREVLNIELAILKNTTRELEENLAQSEKILEPLKIYQELSEVANGTTDRTNKVSFERYVLSIYFSEVLVAANLRFEKMTNGRYELIRREERAKYGAATGLDLDIFDRHSGKTRSVKTLSGGETFQASLALALGLSDVIQNQQGGVRVDTLFIDEGFGTLDADALEMAVETLMDLQANGRMIGIISHVEELKNRIPARIVVEKQQEGSHAKIEVL